MNNNLKTFDIVLKLSVLILESTNGQKLCGFEKLNFKCFLKVKELYMDWLMSVMNFLCRYKR